MLSWFWNDIFVFGAYIVIGIAVLVFLMMSSYLTKWGRFMIGLSLVAYGATGHEASSYLVKSIGNTLGFMQWSEIETPKLINASNWIEVTGIICQFAFAAVGVGLIINTITIRKPFTKDEAKKIRDEEKKEP